MVGCGNFCSPLFPFVCGVNVGSFFVWHKEKGLTPKRKARVAEDHYDDLGDDLSGLGDEIVYLSAN